MKLGIGTSTSAAGQSECFFFSWPQKPPLHRAITASPHRARRGLPHIASRGAGARRRLLDY